MIQVVHYSQTYNETFRLNSVNVVRSWIWICGETETEKHSALYETILQTASTPVFTCHLSDHIYIYSFIIVFLSLYKQGPVPSLVFINCLISGIFTDLVTGYVSSYDPCIYAHSFFWGQHMNMILFICVMYRTNEEDETIQAK